MAFKKLFPALTLGTALGLLPLLSSCSDDVSSSGNVQENAYEKLPPMGGTQQSIYELGKCSEDKWGVRIFVEEEFAFYVCAKNGLWVRITLEEMENPPLEPSGQDDEGNLYSSPYDYSSSSPSGYSSSSWQCRGDIYAWRTEGRFYAYPNDVAPQDSADTHIATGGVYLKLPAAGKYYLSILKDDKLEHAPKLQLFTFSNYDETIEAKDSLGRWFYYFETPYKYTHYDLRRTMLVDDNCDVPLPAIKDFRLEGEGSYSTHFNINLISIGKYMGTSDKVTLDGLAEKIKSRFNEAMNGGGVYVDNVRLLYATDHPSYGNEFTNDSGYVLPYSIYNSDFEKLGNWPGNSNSLNIILGYYIAKKSVLGYAGEFSAALNGATGGMSYIIAGTHYQKDTSIKQTSATELVNTIVHEAGHYLGLHHTSASAEEIDNDPDKSNVEDGIEDTPYCKSANKSSLLVDLCDDRYNIIFPYSSDKTEASFTEGQMELLRKNLSLMEH